MSSFHGLDFVFDGIPSHTFDLKIVNFDDSGVTNGVGSTDVEIITQSILRKTRPYYLGRIQTPVLEFQITFASPKIINAMDRDLISRWLFGRKGYKKLEILQDDLNSAYYMCFLTSPEVVNIGNLTYAFTCTVTCDSPFAYKPEKVISGSMPVPQQELVNRDITIYNDSSEDDYLYPSVYFLSSQSYQSTFTVRNNTDGGREFKFFDVNPLTIVNVNNELRIMSNQQEGGAPPLGEPYWVISYFNKNWLRLLRGKNILRISTNVREYSITYSERSKIGG